MAFFSEYPPVNRDGMRAAVYCQCLGVLAILIFGNGFLLSYFDALGFSESMVLILLSMPNALTFLLVIPCAGLNERFGIKEVGSAGILSVALGATLLIPLEWVHGAARSGLAFTGVGLIGIGTPLMAAGWFALLGPIVPEKIRGRFFGQLRVSFQLVGVIASLLVTKLLALSEDLWLFRIVLIITALAAFIRIIPYRAIPDIDASTNTDKGTFAETFMYALRLPGYMPFCAYCFLISLFTGSSLWIFGLLQSKALGMGSSDLVFMGNLYLIGSLGGFYLGGLWVDKIGTKPIFLVGHMLYGLIYAWIIGRDFLPIPVYHSHAMGAAAFGFVVAAVGIAISSEMLSLMGEKAKSMTSSLNLAVTFAGVTLSAWVMAGALNFQVLAPNWELFGKEMTAYDTILILMMIGVVASSITLSLVPSIIRAKAFWIPRAGGL